MEALDGPRNTAAEHAEVKLLCLRPKDGAIQMDVQGFRTCVACPDCGAPSYRVHSRYTRRLGDLPWEGLPVRIVLSTRRFFCVGDGCRKRIFTEPFSGTMRRYARRTLRATETLDWLTLALGGEAGARMARRLGLLIDGSTQLRQVRRRVQLLSVSAPRVLGVDDWVLLESLFGFFRTFGDTSQLRSVTLICC